MSFCQVAGHLGKDPETRFTPDNKKITTFSVATNVRRGKGETITVWYRVTIFGERFDKMLPYLKKGSAVIVRGTLNEPRIFTDKEGKQQVSLEVIADSVEFSPFGRTDKPEQSQQTPYGAPAQAQASYADPVYAQQGNEPFRGQSGFGANQSDVDNLPF